MSHATAFVRRHEEATPSTDDLFLKAALQGARLPYEPNDWVYNEHVMGDLFAHIDQLTVGHDTDPEAVRAIRIAGQVVNCQLL